MAALRDAGAEPEVFLAEYGQDQYEITLAPTDALAAAATELDCRFVC